MNGCRRSAICREYGASREGHNQYFDFRIPTSDFGYLSFDIWLLSSEIRNSLGDNVFYVKVVDVKWLPNQSADDFKAIVILNRCMAGRPDPRVESFVDDIPDKNKVILLTTGRLNFWKPDSVDIDARSSASAMSETAPLARSIAEKVLNIIESGD